MRYTVCRLDEGSRAALTAHFLALSTIDRHLRFGKALAAEVVAAYVERIDLRRDAVFVARAEDGEIVGAMHVAMEADQAELGLSVLAAHRRRGVAGALFHRAVSHARNRSVPKVLMHCAADNLPIVRLTRKFGMSIATRGGEAVARLDLRPGFVAPTACGLLGMRIAA